MPQEAENLRLRSSLTMALTERITTPGWTQQQAADRIGVTQPRISDLVPDKIELLSMDTSVNTVAAAGLLRK